MILCLLFEERAPTLEIAEACYRFTPRIAVRAHEAVFLEIGGSLKLFSRETIQARAAVLCRRYGVTPRFGVGEDASRALVAARYPGERILPIKALADFLSPFEPVDFSAVEPVVMACVRLGLTSLEEFLQLPERGVLTRFGQDVARAHRRAREAVYQPWPLFRLPEHVSEFTDTECEGLDAVLFVLKSLIDRAMSRLRGRAQRAATIRITLDLERRYGLREHKRMWEIELPFPQGASVSLIPILRDRLDREMQRKPLESPIQRVTFDVLDTAPAHGAQTNFFDKREEEAEAWDALLGRLAARLGESAVFQAETANRHLPEKAWKKIERTEFGMKSEPQFHLSLNRPSRLLRSPELMTVLKDTGGFTTLASSSGRYRVLRVEGPERMNGEWWSEGYERDYFRVQTQAGEGLWIFRTEGRLYLHGFFD